MKYLDTTIGFREFPDEISLLINITGCYWHCPGCHSPELWEDVGTKLTYDELNKLIDSNKGITLVGFMGGQPEEINPLAEYVKNIDPPLKVGWYWGGEVLPFDYINIKNFDYIKIGPYIRELGGLDNPNTNQRFYEVKNGQLIDWTYKFWKHGGEN